MTRLKNRDVGEVPERFIEWVGRIKPDEFGVMGLNIEDVRKTISEPRPVLRKWAESMGFEFYTNGDIIGYKETE